MGFRLVRLKANRFPICADRFSQAATGLESTAEIAEGLGILRLEPESHFQQGTHGLTTARHAVVSCKIAIGGGACCAFGNALLQQFLRRVMLTFLEQGQRFALQLRRLFPRWLSWLAADGRRAVKALFWASGHGQSSEEAQMRQRYRQLDQITEMGLLVEIV